MSSLLRTSMIPDASVCERLTSCETTPEGFCCKIAQNARLSETLSSGEMPRLQHYATMRDSKLQDSMRDLQTLRVQPYRSHLRCRHCETTPRGILSFCEVERATARVHHRRDCELPRGRLCESAFGSVTQSLLYDFAHEDFQSRL